jgi:hypothetical protein
MIMSCARMGDLASVETCAAERFEAVGLSDMCGQCISDFLLKSEVAKDAQKCSRLCIQNDASCANCKSLLATRWEGACNPVSTDTRMKQLPV